MHALLSLCVLLGSLYVGIQAQHHIVLLGTAMLLKLSVYAENQSTEMHLMNTCWPQRPKQVPGPEY